jgi:hypothetical protein
MSDLPEVEVETLIETERFTIWRAKEPDGEIQYHIDMENVTLHMFLEEWEEFVQVIRSVSEDVKPEKRRKGTTNER